MGLVAFFVASAVVTTLQWLRVRDRRFLPLVAMFLLLAAGHFRGEWDGWGRTFHFAAGGAGLLTLVALSPRPAAHR
jgi:hypothetical protein